MRRYLIIFVLFCAVVSTSCKKRGNDVKEKTTPYTITEELDSVPLIVVTDNEVKVLDEKSLTSLDSYKIKVKGLVRSFLFEQNLFIVCQNVAYRVDLNNKEFSKIKFPVKVERAGIAGDGIVISNEHSIFLLSKDGLLTKLKEFKKDLREVYVLSDLSSIIALFQKDEENQLATFSLIGEKFEKEIDLENYVKMRISPFGKRIYVLTEHKLIFLDTKNLELISEIHFKGTGKNFLITGSESRIFIFTENPAKIVSIKRTTMKIYSEKMLVVSPYQEYITGDGGSIFLFASDTLYRFDAGISEIVEKGIAPKGSDLLKASWKGARVISSKRESSELEVFDGNTLLPIKKIALNGKLIDVVFGIKPYRKKSQISLPGESLGVDTTKPIPENPLSKVFTLQVSSSSISEGAKKLYEDIKLLSIPVYIDSSGKKVEQKAYKVKVGAFDTRKDAESFKNGIKETYKISSWVTEGFVDPTILTEVGVDINGDLKRELLLHYDNQLILFTNYEGVIKSVFNRSAKGVELKQKPIVFKEEDKILIGIPFNGDSILAVKWLNNKYEFVKREHSSQDE